MSATAREVGVAVRNRSTIILLVTTGKLSRAAEDYVNDVVRYSPYTIIRFNGDDVRTLARDEAKLLELLVREARRAKELRSRLEA